MGVEVDMAAAMAADTLHGGHAGFGGRGGGWGGGHAHIAGGHFRGGHFRHGFRRVGFWGGGLYAYNGYGCWRWYPGIYGYVRVWVC